MELCFCFLQIWRPNNEWRCYTVKCFVQLVSQCIGDVVAGQIARNISQCNIPSTAKIVARQVARAVAESRIKFYFSCNLSRNDFGRCRKCYTVKCFETFHSVTCTATLGFFDNCELPWKLYTSMHPIKCQSLVENLLLRWKTLLNGHRRRPFCDWTSKTVPQNLFKLNYWLLTNVRASVKIVINVQFKRTFPVS